MKIAQDEELYEILMSEYQIIEVALLNEVLRRNGVESSDLRKKICGEFADSSGSLLDNGWFEGDAERRFWPEIVFSKRTLDPEEGLGDMEEIIVPDYASNFHEYVTGTINLFFDEMRESLEGLRVGMA